MQMTKENIFKRAAADTKGEATSPVAATGEWNQWSEWLEEELGSLGEVHDWSELKSVYATTLPTSGTSLGLVHNFKKLTGAIQIGTNFYAEVPWNSFAQYSNDKKVVSTGYDNGWYVNIKGASEGGSVQIPVQSYFSSLPSPSSVLNFRNPNYIAKRMKVRVFKFNQNPIFTEIEAEADLMLQQMIENEYYKHTQYQGAAPTHEELNGFELGID